GDAGRLHRALGVVKKLPVEIIDIERNDPEVLIAAMVQVNFFAELNPGDHGVGGGIRDQVKVVECVMVLSGFLPNPYTRYPSRFYVIGVMDLTSVRMLPR